MASNNNNNTNNSRPTKHPLEKSLAIFPLVPRTKILVYNPVSSLSLSLSSASSLSSPSASSRRKRRKGASRSANTTTDFDRTNYTTSTQSFSGIERHPLVDDQNFHSTKRKLNQASKYLPKKQDGPLTFKLPPILSSRQSSLVLHQNGESSKDTFPTLNPCICGRKRNHQHKSRRQEQPSLKDQLCDLKYKELAQAYRPDETPRLLSINVRWKTRRDGVSEFNRQTLIETFTPFGEITNVVFTSDNNAVVVFSTADSACTATKVFMKIGREMRLNVKWLNDMNQRN